MHGDSGDQESLTGRRLAQYAVLSLIGAGGMGKVYRARDEQLRRDVAIKVVSETSRFSPGRRMLLTEARALSRLQHPNVAGIYDFVTCDGSDCIVMEFVPGATLREILRGGPLPVAEVLRLGGQMARGLAAAHAARLIHQDIKPANLKVTSSGDLKILDFGVAKVLPGGSQLDSSGDTDSGFGLAGTVPYMAPERLRGEPGDERSDIFGAGAVLYEMAVGRRAFPHLQLALLIEAILDENPEPPAVVNPLVPADLSRVVMRALEKRPQNRHQSAEELARDLDTLAARPARTPRSAWWGRLAGSVMVKAGTGYRREPIGR